MGIILNHGKLQKFVDTGQRDKSRKKKRLKFIYLLESRSVSLASCPWPFQNSISDRIIKNIVSPKFQTRGFRLCQEFQENFHQNKIVFSRIRIKDCQIIQNKNNQYHFFHIIWKKPLVFQICFCRTNKFLKTFLN